MPNTEREDLSCHNRTSRVVPIRLTHVAYEFWAKRAQKAGQSIGGYCRETLEAMASRGKRKKSPRKDG